MSTPKNLNRVFHDTVKDILGMAEASGKKREILELAEELRQKINDLIGKNVPLDAAALNPICGEFQNSPTFKNLPDSLKEAILERTEEVRDNIIFEEVDPVEIDPLEPPVAEKKKEGNKEDPLQTMTDPAKAEERADAFYATSAFRKEDLQQSFNDYKTAAKLSDDPVALRRLAEKVLPFQQPGRVVMICDKAVRLSADYAFCKEIGDFLRAKAGLPKNDPKIAIFAYKKSLEVAKSGAECKEIGDLFLVLDERVLSEEAFKKAIEKTEGFTELSRLSTDIEEVLPDSPVMAMALQKVGEQTKDPKEIRSIADRLLKKNATQEAGEMYKKIIGLSKEGEWGALIGLATELKEKKLDDVAVMAYEKAAALSRNPGQVEELARLIKSFGFAEKAAPLYEKAIDLLRVSLKEAQIKEIEEGFFGTEEATSALVSGPPKDITKEPKVIVNFPGFALPPLSVLTAPPDSGKSERPRTAVMTPAQTEYARVIQFMYSRSPDNEHYNDVLVRLQKVARLAVEEKNEALKAQIRELILTVLNWFNARYPQDMTSVIEGIEKRTGLKLR